MGDLAALVAAVREGAKYRQLEQSLVEAVAAAEMAKGRNFKESVKATRNKLHQVAGAYLPDRPAYAAWLAQIGAARGPDERRAALRQVMAQHASTRERLPSLDAFYATLLGDLPPIHSVLDLACGLNPLAAIWMPLAEDAHYYACDIYADQIAFLNGVFALQGQRGAATLCNLLTGVPPQNADVALLLKTIPCLEQMDREIGARLLAQIDAPVIVVSFPSRSLGGRDKGMVQSYAEHFAELVAGQSWQIARFDFATEMAFRIVR
jgi:16S rRNA (guanine(1405)-N(7))-methyltransferase